MAIIEGSRHDLVIPRGGKFTKTFAWREADQTTVIPLTGYATGQGQIREKPGSSGDPMAEFLVEVDEDAGTVTISLTHAQTTALSQDGYYDVAIIDGGGEPLYVLEGLVSLNERVTIVE